MLLELELPRLLAPDLPSNQFHRGRYILIIPSTRHTCPIPLLIVTTSLCQNWVICAPAASLGCGSHILGTLSGIKPRFPVTRHCQGRPISYLQKLIGQMLERVTTNCCHSVHPVIASPHRPGQTCIDSAPNKQHLIPKVGLSHRYSC